MRAVANAGGLTVLIGNINELPIFDSTLVFSVAKK
jgi:hypothetical protein